MMTPEERKEKIRQRNARYRATHSVDPVKNRAWQRAWQIAHPDRVNAKVSRREALKAGGIVEKFVNLEIFERDGWVCGICHEPVDPNLKKPDPGAVELDHVIPIVKGGSHTRANVQTSHARCNRLKGIRTGNVNLQGVGPDC